MWAGIESTPFDTVEIVPGQTVRAVRGFYRALDTAEVEDRLRAQLFGTTGQLPLPNGGTVPVVYIDDAALAAQKMARALWTKRRDILRGPRVSLESPAGTGYLHLVSREDVLAISRCCTASCAIGVDVVDVGLGVLGAGFDRAEHDVRPHRLGVRGGVRPAGCGLGRARPQRRCDEHRPARPGGRRAPAQTRPERLVDRFHRGRNDIGRRWPSRTGSNR